MPFMSQVSIRDLRNHGGDIVERATRGEQITITRSGQPVAELRALSGPSLSAEALLARHRLLPPLDARALRDDLDQLVDPSL